MDINHQAEKASRKLYRQSSYHIRNILIQRVKHDSKERGNKDFTTMQRG
jgi:hypothetical protein